MTTIEFETFFQHKVIVIANKLCEIGKGKLVFVENLHAAYVEYLSQKALIKRLSGPRDYLDPHKRSACITAVLLRHQQIRDLSEYEQANETCGKNDFLANTMRVNAQLAFLCGLEVLIAHMIADDKKNEEEGKVLPKWNNIILPEEIFHEDGYINSTIRALYYTDIVNLGGVNLLLLSNIFFLLESYHRLAVDKKSVQEELDKLRKIEQEGK
jgi:hypothetical protein